MSNPSDEIMDVLKRQEDLHPDLALCIEKTSFPGSGIVCLRHPLVYGLFYTPQMNAMYNAQYKAKKEYIAKKLEEKDYSGLIWMYERPYRMEKFVEISHDLSDKEYWKLLGSIWADSENLWQYGFILGHLLNSPRPGRENMMDEDEQKLLAELPEQFTVYRGHQTRNRLGYSWTLSYFRAKWFAQRWFQHKKAGVVAGTVNKKDVVAVLLGRNEFEIVCHPQHLQDIHTIGKTRKRADWIEDTLETAKSNFILSDHGSFHGPWHWEKVEKNGLIIAKATPGCDALVVQLFSILHDCKRTNENHDPDHGKRAAVFAKKLHADNLLKISDKQLELLTTACDLHNDGQVSTDPTIGACWDADRLDLTRVGIIPDQNLLSTKAGKELLWKI